MKNILLIVSLYTFLKRLQDISNTSQKSCLLCDLFKTPRTYLKKDVFSVKSLRHLKNISGKHLFQKYPAKSFSCDFFRVITIFDKKDVGPLETLKKWNIFWEQCIDINQVFHEYQWADICVRVLASQRSSKPSRARIIYYFQWFFRLIKLYITRCH